MRHLRTQMPARRKVAPRRAAVLIAVVVCLGVASLLVAAMVSRLMLSHTQMRRQTNVDQAYWLCEAGLQRARQKQAADAEYRGEVWKVPSEDLGGQGSAEVTISIRPADGSDEDHSEQDEATIEVVAKYPIGESFEMQQSQIAPADF